MLRIWTGIQPQPEGDMKKSTRKLVIAAAVFAGVIVAGVIGLNVWRHSLGDVRIPEATQLNESTYRFSDGLNVTQQYLIVGTTGALLIDTGNGLNDLPAAIGEITDLPVTVVNTHGHYDHTHGNHYFDDVYLSEDEADVYHDYNQPETIEAVLPDVPAPLRWLTRYADDATMAMPTSDDFLPLPETGSFDLGDRRISIVPIPGHTPGSIGLIDEKVGALYAGDMVAQGGVLLDLPESLSVSTYRDSIRRLEQLADEGDFDVVYPGHADPLDSSFLKKLDHPATDLIEGDVSAEVLDSGHYELDGATLSFRASNIQ
ncbi:MBL fold metallo-hydrolase [Microbacterium hominis]|uniref:MBL fold metallo-hydrolase n=1 Tax=Microbacterium hominis TaxID=162426 RepID=A0A7D4QC08_9MICO|nr:MBL fold metallo-hydrolase [Microbacterium hominis]QKJ18937.1 MBL fold metallo-hydrolase [Microbacterium hominis]